MAMLPVGVNGLFARAALTRDSALRDEEQPLSLTSRWLFTIAAGRAGASPGSSEASEEATSLADGLMSADALTSLARPGSSLLAAGYTGFGVTLDSLRTLTPPASAPPQLDTAAYTSWNAVAARGLAAAGKTESAAAIVHELFGRMGSDSLLVRFEGDTTGLFHLEDQAAAALAALDLAEVPGREDSPKYLVFATELADRMLTRFRLNSGRFTDRWPDPDSGYVPALDYEMPAAAGLAAELFARLGAAPGDPSTAGYRTAAGHLLTHHLKPNIHRSARLGSLGSALLAYLAAEKPLSPQSVSP